MPGRMCQGFCLLAGFFLVAAPVSAWNSFGHRAVAKIACLEITDKQQMAIFELLKNHPHFKVLKDYPKAGQDTEFFSQGRSLSVSQVEWAILQAATWPDFVRVPKGSKLTAAEIAVHPVHKYHRKFDHFADIPLIDPAFTGKIKDANPGSLLVAIDKAEKDLQDPATSFEDKAIAFCWLAHLAGDIHQPLHCTSFFSKDFPTGDGGGNAFLIGKTNLHSFWDDVLGTEQTTFDHFNAVANDIHRADQLQRGKMMEMKDNLTYQSWADESHKLAVSFVYKDGDKVLQGGQQAHEHDHGSLTIPDFPAGYKTQAKSVVQRRVALGGYRLADKITAIFK